MVSFKKIKEGDLVEVVWVDTYNLALPAWAVVEEIDDEIRRVDNIGGVVCTTSGYFYKIVKRHIYVYGDKMENLFSRLTGIPVGCVIKIKVVKRGE